ncbi:hypothetical protein BKA65DRAFT_512311 [Rhexocercosporidium sp. MPI-PUGE-AT-0058]|nr:hypothetical protein BKA65DRAFT_512311 [Rhexocercosporidium sp. MPI-PUGE-AT-0058]
MSVIYEDNTHKEFRAWAVARGVKLNGIATKIFPGRGLGIIAEKEFNAGDTLMAVPNSALRTVRTVPKNISRSIGAITVHGLLAAELARDTSETRAPWRAILPTKKDFEESMPLMWHPSLQVLLPPRSLSLLENQKRKLSVDWTAVSATFPALTHDSYIYHWFTVGTRTFYYSSPKIKTKRPLSHDDCLAFIPFADCFNHADVGSEVTFSPHGYKICADRHIEKGEEIYISYGNHSNDFLLAEYGFILDDNKWDEIALDEVILPLFSEEQKETLKEAGFFANFVLDRATVCYRTQVALRLLCMLPNRWHQLVVDGLGDEDEYQVAVNNILLKCLKAYLKIVHDRLKQVEKLDCGNPCQRDTLSRRWKQIRLLLTTAMNRVET